MADLRILIGDTEIICIRLPLVFDLTGDVKIVARPKSTTAGRMKAPAVEKPVVVVPPPVVVAPPEAVAPAPKTRRVDVKKVLADPVRKAEVIKAAAKAVSKVDREGPYVVSEPVVRAPRQRKSKPLVAMMSKDATVGQEYFLADGRPILITGHFDAVGYVGYKLKGDRKHKNQGQLPFSYVIYSLAPTPAEVAEVKFRLANGAILPYSLEREPTVSAQKPVQLPSSTSFALTQVGDVGYLIDGRHVVVTEVLSLNKTAWVQVAGDDNPKHAISVSFSARLYG